MATNAQVLRVLVGKTAPMTTVDVAKELGLKANDVSNPLKRMADKDPPWVTRNENDEWSITEVGKGEAVPPTEESEHMTEYQQFLDIGMQIGVPLDQAKLCTEHIWRAGDYGDIEWVAQGLAEQGVRKDMLSRWVNTWRGVLKVPMTMRTRQIVEQVRKDGDTTLPPVTNSKDVATGNSRLRDYILDASNHPLYVGEFCGDLEYADALRLSSIELAKQARLPINNTDVTGGGKGGAVSDALAIIDGMKKLGGDGEHKKTLLMIPGENGYTLQEVDAGSSVVIPKTETKGNDGRNDSQGVWYMDPNDNQMKQAAPGQPIVIIKKESPGGGGNGNIAPRSYLYKEDGSMVEFDPTKPVVIKQAAPVAPASGPTMLNAVTADGKPIQIDIDSYFKLEDHKAKMQRDQESHEVKMDIAKGLKDLVSKGARALGHMGEGVEEE
jgi:hypothetical protein